MSRATAAVGKFPYPHRTCAEWHIDPHGGLSLLARNTIARPHTILRDGPGGDASAAFSPTTLQFAQELPSDRPASGDVKTLLHSTGDNL